eukprot:3152046-Pyramimonas_sp.AAC.1
MRIAGYMVKLERTTYTVPSRMLRVALNLSRSHFGEFTANLIVSAQYSPNELCLTSQGLTTNSYCVHDKGYLWPSWRPIAKNVCSTFPLFAASAMSPS